MAANIANSSLSPARQCLVRILRRLQFGNVLGLHVRGGEPVFDPPPTLVRDVKFPLDPAAKKEVGEDYLLKQQILELFEHFDRLVDGVIDAIEVKHGLPFRLQQTEALS